MAESTLDEEEMKKGSSRHWRMELSFLQKGALVQRVFGVVHFIQEGVARGGVFHNCFFLLQVRAKLELGLNHDRPPEPTLSASQSRVVLEVLTEGWVLSKLIHGLFTVVNLVLFPAEGRISRL